MRESLELFFLKKLTCWWYCFGYTLNILENLYLNNFSSRNLKYLKSIISYWMFNNSKGKENNRNVLNSRKINSTKQKNRSRRILPQINAGKKKKKSGDQIKENGKSNLKEKGMGKQNFSIQGVKMEEEKVRPNVQQNVSLFIL